MYWHLRTKADSPLYIKQMAKKKLESGEIDKLSGEEQVKLAEQFRGWELSQGRNYYKPNPKEIRFFLEPKFQKWISGGNRSGKTATCVMDVVMQCEGWHPLQKENLIILAKDAIDAWVREEAQRLLDEKKWIKSPPVYWRVVAVDFPNYVERVIGPEYEKWLTHADVLDIGYDNEKKRKITWKNKSIVEFMTLLQDVKSHGGAARDGVQFDEEPTSEHYSENLMRVVSTRGRIVGGMTAVNGITWTEDQIWSPGEKGDKDIHVMEMSTYENPMNSADIIEQIIRNCLDQTEIDIRIHGKRKARGGSVYKMAKDESPWILPRFELPSDGGYLIMAIDTHPRVPHAVLWIYIDYEGKYHELIDDKPNLYEVAELFEYGTIPELGTKIKMMEIGVLKRSHDYALCEPGAWNKDQTKLNEKSIVEQLNDIGIFPDRGSKDLTGGLLKVADLLTLTTDHPRLMCFEDLNRTRWERKNYRWPEWRGIAKDNKSPKEKPVDKDDHIMECERRICEYVVDGNFEFIDIEMLDKKHRVITESGAIMDIDLPREPEFDAMLGE